MNTLFLLLTVVFIIVAAVMILIILVQRPQGGGLAGAFGGAGGGSTDTVFGGRVGDALTLMTVAAFVAYLALAIGLNLVPIRPPAPSTADTGPVITSTSPTGETTTVPLERIDSPPWGDQPPQQIPLGEPIVIPPTTPPVEPSGTEEPPPQDEEPAAETPPGAAADPEPAPDDEPTPVNPDRGA